MTQTRRPAMGALFILLGAAFVFIAVEAARAGDAAWIVAGVSALLAVWMGELAYKALRSHREGSR